jgi:muramoyltetrapeptide carboxypeptidase
MDMIVPDRLKPGDTIGVFTASDPIEPPVTQWVEAGISRLKEMGFKVIEGATLTKSSYYTAGTPQERWEDFKSLITNNEVTLIMTAMGGSNAHQILELMDFELIRANPKIIMGYSNPTVLLNPIAQMSHLVTFYGFHAASFDPDWEWFDEYDLEHFDKVLQSPVAPMEIEPSDPRESWRGGSAEGAFVGGCLQDLRNLIGTPWEPDWEGKILFLEDISNPPKLIDVDLTHLKLAGAFDQIAGLLLGKFYECVDAKNPHWNKPLKHLVTEVLGEYDFPILKTNDFGHFSHMSPIPIGCRGRIDSSAKAIEILEPCVQ